jgi:glycosyltransferase involved in cell wall biosynthesis
MPKFIACCNLALCTSTHEGWPNSLKEALACNIPFVSTDVSDMAGIASRREVCKVGAPNAEALSSMIESALKLPADPELNDEVADMALEKVSQRIASLYLQILELDS